MGILCSWCMIKGQVKENKEKYLYCTVICKAEEKEEDE